MRDARPNGDDSISFAGKLLADAGSLLLRLVAMTWRIRVSGWDEVEALNARGLPPIFAIWHGHLLSPLWTYRNRGFVALISRHGDGALIARVTSRLGFRSVRGSSTRGGSGALRQLLREADAGQNLVFTPDGPRGPRHRAQLGVVYAARLSGLPIVPVGVGSGRAWRFRSWDRFEVPKPFSRVRINFAAAIEVPRATSTRDLESYRQRVEAALLAADADAERTLADG